MALPTFFDRVYAAAGGVTALSRESLERELGQISVGIVLDPAWAGDVNASRIADLLVNLSSRLYGALFLQGPDAWVARASALARSINPDVTIGDGMPTLRAVVGNVAYDGSVLYVRNDGWVARVHETPDGRAPGAPNPFAGSAAAALSAGELFRRAFHARVPAVPFRGVDVSLLDFTTDGGAGDALVSARLDDVGFVGVGAVGNAAIWCLAGLERIDGRIALVDGQRIDATNLQRYVLSDTTNIDAWKTDVAAERLEHTGAIVEKMTMALEDAANLRVPASIAVSVDNIDGRRSAQALLPRLAVNGWTSDRGLGASWHELGGDGPCLACEYHPVRAAPSQYDVVSAGLGLPHDRVTHLWISGQGVTASDLAAVAAHLKVERNVLAPWIGKRLQELFTDVVCGAVALDLSGVGRLEAVPLAHQSMLAGTLMAAELVKRTDSGLRARAQTAPYVVWDDVLHPPPTFWTQRRARRQGCFCGDDVYRRRYAAKWSGNVKRGGH